LFLILYLAISVNKKMLSYVQRPGLKPACVGERLSSIEDQRCLITSFSKIRAIIQVIAIGRCLLPELRG